MNIVKHKLIAASAGCSPMRNIIEVFSSIKKVVFASGVHLVISSSAGDDSVCGDDIIIVGGDAGVIRVIKIVEFYDSQFILAGCTDGTIRSWDTRGQLLSVVSVSASVEYISVLHLSEKYIVNFVDCKGTIYEGTISSSGILSSVEKIIQVPSSIFVTSMISCSVGDGTVLLMLGHSDNTVAIYSNNILKLSLPGHTNWILSMDICWCSASSFLLATGSADRTVRVWRCNLVKSQCKFKSETILTELIPRPDCIDGVGKFECEAIYYGHEDRVQSVRWLPPHSNTFSNSLNRSFTESPQSGQMSSPSVGEHVNQFDGSTLTQKHISNPHVKDNSNNSFSENNSNSGASNNHPMYFKSPRLVSAASDHSIIVWEVGRESMISRIGSVGRPTFGFFSAIPSLFTTNSKDSGYLIYAHGKTGTIACYKLDMSCRVISGLASSIFSTGHVCGVGLSGTAGSIVSLSFESASGMLGTCGSGDRTTRLWSCSNVLRNQLPTNKKLIEVYRPQQHGYEMKSLCLSTYGLISAGDEKILRAFTHPNYSSKADMGVIQPALGLSNKINVNTQHTKSLHSQMEIQDTPQEEEELLTLLWPESDKLYGHGMEISVIATSPCGKFVASASKATNEEDATILLWSLEASSFKWKLLDVRVKAGHRLTITRLSFSPLTGRYLVATSRDRTWSITDVSFLYGESLTHLQSSRTIDMKNLQTYQSDEKSESSHRKQIWALGWAPDEAFFVTGSRDCSIKMWYWRNYVETEVLKEKKVNLTKLEDKNRDDGLRFSPDDKGHLFGELSLTEKDESRENLNSIYDTNSSNQVLTKDGNQIDDESSLINSITDLSGESSSKFISNKKVSEKSNISTSKDLVNEKHIGMGRKFTTTFDYQVAAKIGESTFSEKCTKMVVKTVETDSPVTSIAVNNQLIAVGLENGRLSFFNHALDRLDESIDSKIIDTPCSRINGLQWTNNTSNHLILAADYIAIYEVDAYFS